MGLGLLARCSPGREVCSPRGSDRGGLDYNITVPGPPFVAVCVIAAQVVRGLVVLEGEQIMSRRGFF